jgi:hypothetical protein
MKYESPLSRGSVHDNVDPKNLHSVQGVRDSHQGSQRNQGQSCNTGAQLEPHKIPDVVENAFSFLDGSTKN